MRIAWYLGFGWLSIVTVIACGIAINRLEAPISWAFYLPFLVVAVWMTVRFHLYNTEAWRRVHARTMIAYGELAGREYDAAKKEGRDFDVGVPCRALAHELFPERSDEAIEALMGDGRRAYYKELVTSYPEVFVKGVAEDRKAAVLEGLRSDIDASELGPDILIAQAIERRHERREAAKYLHALLLGRVR
jgi:hypothetical protein